MSISCPLRSDAALVYTVSSCLTATVFREIIIIYHLLLILNSGFSRYCELQSGTATHRRFMMSCVYKNVVTKSG